MLHVAEINAHCAPRQAVGTCSAAWMTGETKKNSTIRTSSGHEKVQFSLSNRGKFQACKPCVEHKNCLQADWSVLAPLGAQSATGTSGHLFRQVEPSTWAEETNEGELTRRKRFSTVTAALFRVLNTLSDPFHVQNVPHGQFEANALRKGVVNVRYL